MSSIAEMHAHLLAQPRATATPPSAYAQPGLRAVGVGAYEPTVATVVGLTAVGIAAVAGVGALIGMGGAAAIADKGKKPEYTKGAAIGAGAGLLLGLFL